MVGAGREAGPSPRWRGGSDSWHNCTMQTTSDPETVPDGKEAVDTATAAKRLGLPIAALEQALERGFVDGRREPDGVWLVLLDRPAPYAPIDQPSEMAISPPAATGLDQADEPADVEAMPKAPAADAAPAPAPESPPESAPAPTEPSDFLDYLRDEVRFLRHELARRDDMLAAKDGAIAKLIERFAEVNVEIVQRVPSADTIQNQISQTHQSHRQVAERHERELNTIKDVLNSLRGYLAHQSTEDES